MRFDSISALIQLIAVLSNLGYSAPAIDYKRDMIAHGLTKHISFYQSWIKVEINDRRYRQVVIDFYSFGDKVYSIICKDCEDINNE